MICIMYTVAGPVFWHLYTKDFLYSICIFQISKKNSNPNFYSDVLSALLQQVCTALVAPADPTRHTSRPVHAVAPTSLGAATSPLGEGYPYSPGRSASSASGTFSEPHSPCTPYPPSLPDDPPPSVSRELLRTQQDQTGWCGKFNFCEKKYLEILRDFFVKCTKRSPKSGICQCITHKLVRFFEISAFEISLRML